MTAILVMQMKVKGQISFCYVSQEILCPIEPKFCMHMECDETTKWHNKMELI